MQTNYQQVATIGAVKTKKPKARKPYTEKELREAGREVPEQTEKPAIPTPEMIALVDTANYPPAIEQLQALGYYEAFKCLLRAKEWMTMDRFAYLFYGAEAISEMFKQATYVDVEFHAERLNATACHENSPKVDREFGQIAMVGYATGRKMIGGIINSTATQQIVRFDRERECFVVDGEKVIGAEAIILAPDCTALVINPVFAPKA